VPPVVWICAACGYQAPPDDPFPCRCPRAVAAPSNAPPGSSNARAGSASEDVRTRSSGAGESFEDGDHVLERRIDPSLVSLALDGPANPFLRYRTMLHSYHLARSGGWSDAQYVDLVERLDAAVAEIDGSGFVETPFRRADRLSKRLGLSPGSEGRGDADADRGVDPIGGVFVKDETGNVSGSHKARHLMGIAIYLRRIEALGGPLAARYRAQPLAIASCGNAALAAAVVARAAGRELHVFVPPDAEGPVVERLQALGARLTVCPRDASPVPGGVAAGDPCYLRYREFVRSGAIPFSCQGNENALTLEGGATLAYEMIGELARTGRTLDRIFVQVGGGALASSLIQGFREGVQLGLLPRFPRIHAVQTEGAHPLKRAYDRVVARALGRDSSEGSEGSSTDAPGDRERTGTEEPDGRAPLDQAESIATALLDPSSREWAEEALRYAVTHRSRFMWPWGVEPRSLARGILDDETYDWFAVVRGMIESGGYPIVVTESELREAHTLAAETTGIPVDPTGSAGLAGLLQFHRGGRNGGSESVVVLFTGVTR
jgi:threonine synthase